MIDGAVYRGGQPLAAEFIAMVQELKLRTIVKLNYDDEGSDSAAPATVMHIAMPPRDLAQAIGAPDDADVARAVAALCDEANWPVFVHCTHGQDRTGLVVGEFRVSKQNWSITQAWDEMLAHGFHWELIDLSRSWMRFVESSLSPSGEGGAKRQVRDLQNIQNPPGGPSPAQPSAARPLPSGEATERDG